MKTASNLSLKLGANVILGPSQSGKTYLLQGYIKEYHSMFESFIVMGRNEKSLEDWGLFFHSIGRTPALFYNLQSSVLHQLEEEQKKDSTRGRIPPKVMVIFDDIIGSNTDDKAKRMRNENSFEFVFFNSRHLHIVSVVLIQSARGVSRDQLDNSGCTVIFPGGSYFELQNHTLPKCLYNTSWMWKDLLRASPGKRRNHYMTLLDDLGEYECVYVLKKKGKAHLYRYKAT